MKRDQILPLNVYVSETRWRKTYSSPSHGPCWLLTTTALCMMANTAPMLASSHAPLHTCLNYSITLACFFLMSILLIVIIARSPRLLLPSSVHLLGLPLLHLQSSTSFRTKGKKHGYKEESCVCNCLSKGRFDRNVWLGCMADHERVEYRNLEPISYAECTVLTGYWWQQSQWCSREDASWHGAGRSAHGTAKGTHYLLGKVNVLRLEAFLFAWCLSSCPADLLRFERRFVGLQYDVVVVVDIVDAEVVVIRTGQDVSTCQH
jgi:hypothetical protein